MKKSKIVITGGPGGGKTTALDLFSREFKTQVKIVPEAATILYQYGLKREHEAHGKMLLQESIFQLQLTLEEIYERMNTAKMIICDRGTLDGMAYWPEDNASFFKRMNTTLEKEMSRYDAVIFFETGASHGSDKSNNPYREEDTKTAIELDLKLKTAWESHPNFHFIPSNLSFMSKISHGFTILEKVFKSL